jgi:hypothetical protein
VRKLDELKRVFAVRWPSFTPEEVLSPDGLILVDRKGEFPLQGHALDKLQAFRLHLGRPLIVNSPTAKRRGWRSVAENRAIQGSLGNKADTFSYHVAGVAFDISVPGISTRIVFDEAKKFGFTGVGLYSTWVHIDTRFLINPRELKLWAGSGIVL